MANNEPMKIEVEVENWVEGHYHSVEIRMDGKLTAAKPTAEAAADRIRLALALLEVVEEHRDESDANGEAINEYNGLILIAQDRTGQ